MTGKCQQHPFQVESGETHRHSSNLETHTRYQIFCGEFERVKWARFMFLNCKKGRGTCVRVMICWREPEGRSMSSGKSMLFDPLHLPPLLLLLHSTLANSCKKVVLLEQCKPVYKVKVACVEEVVCLPLFLISVVPFSPFISLWKNIIRLPTHSFPVDVTHSVQNIWCKKFFGTHISCVSYPP